MLRLAKITTVVTNAAARTAGKPASVPHLLRAQVLDGAGRRSSSVLDAAIKSLIGEMVGDDYLLRCSAKTFHHRDTEAQRFDMGDSLILLVPRFSVVVLIFIDNARGARLMLLFPCADKASRPMRISPGARKLAAGQPPE